MKLTAALLAALALALAGCAAVPSTSPADVQGYMQRMASGEIGCPPGEIGISDHQPGTFTATCRGVVHYCRWNRGDLRCTRAVEPAGR